MASRHGDSFWEEERGNVGLRLMQGMGWSLGDGLGKTSNGPTTNLRVKKRKGNEGIGTSKDSRDDTWSAATSAFNDLLKRLNSCTDAAVRPATTMTTGNTTTAIQKHRSRQKLYGRFRKGKDTTMYSVKAMDEIFGRRECQGKAMGSNEQPGLVTNKTTIDEYFKQKRAGDSAGPVEMVDHDDTFMVATNGKNAANVNHANDVIVETTEKRKKRKVVDIKTLKNRTDDDLETIVNKRRTKDGLKKIVEKKKEKKRNNHAYRTGEKKRTKVDDDETIVKKQKQITISDQHKTVQKKKVKPDKKRTKDDDETIVVEKKRKKDDKQNIVKKKKKSQDDTKPSDTTKVVVTGMSPVRESIGQRLYDEAVARATVGRMGLGMSSANVQ